ncbi:MAG: acyl carrier protein [Holophagaceae bacterium]
MIRPIDPFHEDQDWPADVPGQVNLILVRLFELDAATVTASARMREDLDLDSLDGVDIVIALEKQYGFIAEENSVTKLKTVGEIHAYVAAKLASRAS